MVVRRLLGPFAGRGPLPALRALAALVLALLPGRAAVAEARSPRSRWFRSWPPR